MKTIRKYTSFSNLVACMALFVALSGTAYAAAKNSIGSAQLKKNAVTSQKIKKNAVTNAKIKNNSVTSSKIKDGSVTGADVNAASLAKVPAAAEADQAAALAGQKNVFIKLSFGQEVPVVENGSVSISAKCIQNDGGNDYIRLIAKTTQDGAILGADDDLDGGPAASDFLNTTTAEADRDFEYSSATTGTTSVNQEIDSGFVLGPDGKMITSNTEGLAMGVNYLGANCVVAGIFNTIG